MKRFIVIVITFFIVLCLYPFCVSAQYAPETTPEPPSPTAMLEKTETKPIEIWIFPGTHRLVTGKALILTVQVIWRLGINVHFEDLMDVDLSPFKVDNVTVGERQIFDNERDFRVIQYILSLPEDAKEGKYTVPSFGVSFVDEVAQMEGLATSTPVTVKKVPLTIIGKVDKDVIQIGDIIRYHLTILYEKDTEILLKNLQEVSFEPFVLLHSSFQHEETPQIKKLKLDYYLSIYEMGGEKRKYEIPPVSVFYYKPDGLGGEKQKVVEMEEVQTQPVPVIINKLLKVVDVPLEGQKGPITYSRSELYFRGYFLIFLGVSLFLLVLVPAGLRSIRENFFPPKEEPSETPELVVQGLRALLSSFRFSGEKYQDRKHLEGVDTALRVYLGSLSNMPREKALAITTSEMLTRIPAEIALPSEEILRGLDTQIFGGSLERKKVEELIGRIEELLQPGGEDK